MPSTVLTLSIVDNLDKELCHCSIIPNMRHRKCVKRRASTSARMSLLTAALVFMVTIQCGGTQSQSRPSNASPLLSEKYFGTPLAGFHSPGLTVKGEVFIVDDSTLFLRGFSFAGSAYPFSFFHAGSSPGPDGTGFNIADERGSTRPLGDYRDKDIVIRLPEGRNVRDIRWLSIWSRTIHANLGHVFIPINSVIPAPLELPPITGLTHGIRSGPISIIDAQTVLLTDFWYDGTGPSAYFWVTRGPRQTAAGLRLKDENDTPRPMRPYRGESFLIRLPDLKTVYDFDWFGVWSEEFQMDMGHFHLPQHVRVPPSSRMLGVKPEHKLNCQVLDDRRGFELRWVMDGDDIVMQLVAKLQPREYMAFGLSKDDHRSIMTGADAAVTWIDEAGTGHAVDYFLGSKEQCVGSRGSCPDLKHAGATDSITLLHSAVVNGFTMVTFKRPQLAVDELYDQHVYSDGQQGVIWAIGTLNSHNEAAYHNLRTIGNRYMDFARPPTWNCPRPDEALLSHRRFQRLSVAASSQSHKNASSSSPTPIRSSKPQVPEPEVGSVQESNLHPSHKLLPGWKIPAIRCPRDRTFVAKIGPAGKFRGYSKITGRQGRPIAWYINGLLIPELVLKRHQVYTFLVEGGDDVANPGRRHPLYLTDSPEGGFQGLSNEERMRERVFAGVGLTTNGTVAPVAEGKLCEWKETPGVDANTFERFEDYAATLRLDCQEGQPGMLRFKADDKTPEVLYYQDFMHKNLGWKIRIVDECDDAKPTTSGQVLHTPAASISRPVKVAPPMQIKGEPEMKKVFKQKQQPQYQHPLPVQNKPQPQSQHFLPQQHPLTHQLLGGAPMMFQRANFNLLPHTFLQPFQKQSQNHFNPPPQSQRPYYPIFSNPTGSQQSNNVQSIQKISNKIKNQAPNYPGSGIAELAPVQSKYPMKKIGQQAQSGQPYYPNSNRRVHHSHPVPAQQALRPLRPIQKVPSMASGFVPISLSPEQIAAKHHHPHPVPHQPQPQPQLPVQQPQQVPPPRNVQRKPGYRYKKIGSKLTHKLRGSRPGSGGDFFRLSAIKPTQPPPAKITEMTTVMTTTTTTPAPTTTTTTMTPSTTTITTTMTPEITTTMAPTTTTSSTPITTQSPATESELTTTESSITTTTMAPSSMTPTTEMAIIADMSSEESQRRLVMSTLNGFKATSGGDHVTSESSEQASAINPDDTILRDVMRMISFNSPSNSPTVHHNPRHGHKHRNIPQSAYRLQHNLF